MGQVKRLSAFCSPGHYLDDDDDNNNDDDADHHDQARINDIIVLKIIIMIILVPLGGKRRGVHHHHQNTHNFVQNQNNGDDQIDSNHGGVMEGFLIGHDTSADLDLGGGSSGLAGLNYCHRHHHHFNQSKCKFVRKSMHHIHNNYLTSHICHPANPLNDVEKFISDVYR